MEATLFSRVPTWDLRPEASGRCVTQIRTIREKLDAGILDLNFQPVSRDEILRSIERFRSKVLRHMHEV